MSTEGSGFASRYAAGERAAFSAEDRAKFAEAAGLSVEAWEEAWEDVGRSMKESFTELLRHVFQEEECAGCEFCEGIDDEEDDNGAE